MNRLLLAKFYSELLDPSFLFALDNGERYSVQPMRFTALFKSTRVKVKYISLYIVVNASFGCQFFLLVKQFTFSCAHT